uniref:Uncharacterized protein n=1 Tax=Glossina palpalis gambiensis TaxID=67801 RepID=A0A1B0BZN3_9MUSC
KEEEKAFAKLGWKLDAISKALVDANNIAVNTLTAMALIPMEKPSLVRKHVQTEQFSVAPKAHAEKYDDFNICYRTHARMLFAVASLEIKIFILAKE